MIWYIMDTYDLVRDIEGPFTSRTVWGKMKALGMSDTEIKTRCHDHLRWLTKEGYLTRTGVKKAPTGNTYYIYEVVEIE